MADKKFTNAEMDFMMHKLANDLQNLFGDSAGVHCIKGNGSFEHQLVATYMKFPILKVEVSRQGCNIDSGMCSIDDIIECLPHTIGSLLGLVPEKYRNQILAEAIQEDMTEDGNLMDNLKEQHRREDDEDEDDE